MGKFQVEITRTRTVTESVTRVVQARDETAAEETLLQEAEDGDLDGCWREVYTTEPVMDTTVSAYEGGMVFDEGEEDEC